MVFPDEGTDVLVVVVRVVFFSLRSDDTINLVDHNVKHLQLLHRFTHLLINSFLQIISLFLTLLLDFLQRCSKCIHLLQRFLHPLIHIQLFTLYVLSAFIDFHECIIDISLRFCNLSYHFVTECLHLSGNIFFYFQAFLFLLHQLLINSLREAHVLLEGIADVESVRFRLLDERLNDFKNALRDIVPRIFVENFEQRRGLFHGGTGRHVTVH